MRFKIIRKSNESHSHGFRYARRRIGGKQHFNLSGNGKAVFLNFPVGQSKFRGQMHAGDNQLQLHGFRLIHFSYNGL